VGVVEPTARRLAEGRPRLQVVVRRQDVAAEGVGRPRVVDDEGVAASSASRGGAPPDSIGQPAEQAVGDGHLGVDSIGELVGDGVGRRRRRAVQRDLLDRTGSGITV
jgi:hypothetical protein